jgi:hypothetical protein
MSRIAPAGVSRSMIMPGGMMVPPTSRADSDKFTQLAGAAMPIASASNETRASDANFPILKSVGARRCRNSQPAIRHCYLGRMSL